MLKNFNLKGNEASYIKYGFIICLLLLVVFFFKDLLDTVKSWLGIDKVEQEQEIAEKQKNTFDSNLETQKAKQPSTKNDADWLIIANQIYQDLRYSSIDDNKKDAVYQVCRVKNDTDVYSLFAQFGERQEYAFGIPIGTKKSLSEFIRSNLNTEQINIINSNYTRKGIKFQY